MGWQEVIKQLCELLCRMCEAEVQDARGRIVGLGIIAFRVAQDRAGCEWPARRGW